MNTKWTKETKLIQWFSPEVHMLAGMLHPRCVDHTLGDSVANRCFTNLAQQMGAARTKPQVKVTQWHEQCIRATLWLLRLGRCNTPHKSSWDGHEQSPTRANAPPLLQAISVAATTKSNKKTVAKQSLGATRCNHTSKCTWNHSISLLLALSSKEMSGREYAQLNGMSSMSKCQERPP